MKKLIIFFALVMGQVGIWAQQDTLHIEDRRKLADTVFGLLNQNLFEGKLLDRTLSDNFITLEQTKGNYLQIHDVFSFINLYGDISFSYVDTNIILSGEKFVDKIINTCYHLEDSISGDSLIIPFGLAIHNLFMIDTIYYDTNYISSQNYQLIPLIPENEIYKKVQIKTAAIMEFEGDTGFEFGIVKYVPELISLSSDITNLTIQIDLGNGFKNFGPQNSEINYSRTLDSVLGKIAVSYKTDDIIILDTLNFYVTTKGTGLNNTKGNDDGWDEVLPYTRPDGPSLNYGIKYGCGNDNKIRRPIILVPPYRPSIQPFAMQKYWDQFNFKSLLSSLSNMGYDVIFIKEFKGNERIETAGKVIASFILYMNQVKKENFPDEDWENVAIGFSAGGQHLRYALNYLEQRHTSFGTEHHHTKLYTSFDSPHWGVNIPMFTQTVYRDLSPTNVLAHLAYQSLTDNGSKDMAMAHTLGSDVHQVSTSSVWKITPAPTAERTELVNKFMNDFLHYYSHPSDLRRSFPSFTRNIAISTGSNSVDYDQAYSLYPGMKLFDQDAIGVGFLGYQIKDRKLYASGGGYRQVFKNKQTVITFLFPIVIKDRIYYTQNALSLDMAQGGYKDEFFDKFPTGAVPIMRFGTAQLGQKLYDNHISFLPLVSALGINPSIWQNNNLYYNMKDNGLMYQKYNYIVGQDESNNFGYPHLAYPNNHFDITPFEAVYSHSLTYEHIKMQKSVDENGYDDVYLVHLRDFILDEVEADHVFLQNKTIGKNHMNWDPTYKYRAWYSSWYAISIGNHVTPKTDPGDYIIEPTGDITVYAGQEIYLLDGFYAQQGSEFYAYIKTPTCSRPRMMETYGSDENDDQDAMDEYLNFTDKSTAVSNDVETIKVFPNPNSGKFIVDIPEEFLDGRLIISDLFGNKIIESDVKEFHIQLQLNLSKGVYIVQIEKNSEVQNTKLIVL